MLNLSVSPPDQDALNRSAQAFLVTAKHIVIDSHEMYQVAADELAAIKGKVKGLEEQRTKLVAPLNQVVKDINAMFKPPMDFLTQAESTIKRSMLTYQEDVDRRRREEEARARAAAEAEAARERARIEQERAATAEKARLEQERLEQERQAALAAGDTVKAEDPLVSLESDKATMDVPAPLGGVVQEIRVKIGDKVSEDVSSWRYPPAARQPRRRRLLRPQSRQPHRPPRPG